MGTYNKFTKQWCTVAKCGNGHDDKTLEKINKELQVTKISKVRLSDNATEMKQFLSLGSWSISWGYSEIKSLQTIVFLIIKEKRTYTNIFSQDSTKVPLWLSVHKTLVPDFVVSDPKVKK
jgi:ATP-dependent DNA ligase